MCSVWQVLIACHDDPQERRASEDGGGLGLDAAGLSPLVDPPRPAGDFKADVDGFTTLEACMKDRSKLDPVVGDALDNIGYGTFLRDACRVLEAAKLKDKKMCALIDAGTLRQYCESVVAIVTRDPDACPSVSVKPALGRDPLCVAEASRSPALCAAVELRDQPQCNAVVGKDDKTCDSIEIEEDRTACKRDSARWRTVMQEGQALVAQVPKSQASLEVHGADGAATHHDLDVARGVVFVRDPKRSHLALGETEDLASPHATAPTSRAKLALVLLVGDKPEVRDLTLSVPGGAALSCGSSHCDLSVKVTKVEETRGGVVDFVVDGTVGTAPQAFRIHAEVKTFVRDVAAP